MKFAKREILPYAIISTIFIVWSIIFLYRSSFIAIDGNRYSILFDDAMISMRYAFNLVHGYGLVWNPGEAVEGYTNLLMTLIMALAIFIFGKYNAILAIQVFGILTLVFIGMLAVRIGRFTFDHELSLPSPNLFLIALSYYPLAYFTINGMETGLVALLLYVAILLSIRYSRNPSRNVLLLTGIVIGLVYLTRPDSILQGGIILVFLVLEIQKKRTWRSFFIELFFIAVPIFLIILAHIAFRLFYYGTFVPNTYVLKMTGMPLVDRLRNGFGFSALFLATNAFLILVVAIQLARKPNKLKLLIAGLVLSATLYQIWIGGDAWPYWRMVAPFMPLFFILFANSVHELMRSRIIQAILVVRKSAFFIVLFGLILSNEGKVFEVALIFEPFRTTSKIERTNIALALDELIAPDATIGVIAAGTIPYFSERKAVDFLGKCDPYIAGLPADLSQNESNWVYGTYSLSGHNKYDLGYSIMKIKPVYVQRLTWRNEDITEWGNKYYQQVEYKGVSLLLLQDSPLVRWDLLRKTLK